MSLHFRTLVLLTLLQLISELADTVAACLLDVTDLSVGVKYEAPASEDSLFGHQLHSEGLQQGLFSDLESSIRKGVADNDRDAIQDVVRFSVSLAQTAEGRVHVMRILWKAIIDAPVELADFILASTSTPFDYRFIDDINGRTCLHEAARVGALRLVDLCLQSGVQRDKVDVYGRSALHYAAMNGHSAVCQRLIEEGLSADALDLDNCTPLIYATLRGSVECVRVLLEIGHVSAQATVLNGDLMPLSLAARSGHYDVVVLLLRHGAPSLPNTNGEYPIHLAAQEGHDRTCRLLVGQEGWDTPDKYNEWTPLFHAARYGHEQCLRVLLEAGSRADYTDELENSAVHYAAWYGHHTCVSLLMEAKLKYTTAHAPLSHTSPMSDTLSTTAESDIDAIPSLSLPPPMMPYRVYGHNYLDKNALVQVSIGHHMSRYGDRSAEPSNAVRLRPPLSGLERTERYLHTSPRLKLVVTASPAVTAAPFSVTLPLAADERTTYMFQVPSVDALSLEFSLYPNFGTKIVGRAASLPSSLRLRKDTEAMTLPIFDHRLNVIGEVIHFSNGTYGQLLTKISRLLSRSTSSRPSVV
jgi:CDK inhibitor PHO81